MLFVIDSCIIVSLSNHGITNLRWKCC